MLDVGCSLAEFNFRVQRPAQEDLSFCQVQLKKFGLQFVYIHVIACKNNYR